MPPPPIEVCGEGTKVLTARVSALTLSGSSILQLPVQGPPGHSKWEALWHGDVSGALFSSRLQMFLTICNGSFSFSYKHIESRPVFPSADADHE